MKNSRGAVESRDVVYLAYAITFSVILGFSLLCFVLVGLYKANAIRESKMEQEYLILDGR